MTAAVRFRLLEHASCDSTSERAFADLAAGRARHGDVHTAREQTAGRGRRGRRWHSPPGEGLYLSLVWRPGPPPLAPAALTMAAGLAVQDALAELGLGQEGRAGARLKWPNDVEVGGAKLAGLLVETRGLDPAAPDYVVGVGLNVAQRAFPAELVAERPVTSLALAGLEVGLDAARDAVLEHLGRRLAGARAAPEALAADYLAATGLAGHSVRVALADGERAGRLVGLSLARGLEIVGADGAPARLALEHVRGVRRAADGPAAEPPRADPALG